jgi:hypothetical protein
MLPSTSSFHSPWQLLSRQDLVLILRTALTVGASRFARHAAYSWLAYFPGDLPVNKLYAQALHQAGQAKHALNILENTVRVDPEYQDAWFDITNLLNNAVQPPLPSSREAFLLADSQAAIHAQGGSGRGNTPLPAWASSLRQARAAMLLGDFHAAENHIHKALLAEPTPPLVAVVHLQVAQHLNLPSPGLLALAEHYHERFPACQVPTLVIADALIKNGDSEKGVSLLHQSAAQDVTGQVASRLWGSDHSYRDLWPERLEAPLELALPAEVAVVLGWNCLPEEVESSDASFRLIPDAPSQPVPSNIKTIQPLVDTVPIPVISQTRPAKHGPPEVIAIGVTTKTSSQPEAQPYLTKPIPSPYDIPETLRSVQQELEKVAINLKQNQLARADMRFPVYVVLTTRQGLQKQYGMEGFEAIDQELKRLVRAVSSRRDWSALLIYADDPDCMATLSLKPAKADDPWSIKLTLVDLDGVLSRQGEMIGALLIIGGPEIVPFHHLPNPVDDIDTEVPSDSPYATRDENYFVPEWPLGRLPGGSSSNSWPLLEILKKVVIRHQSIARKEPWYRLIWAGLRARLKLRPGHTLHSWGYTASIWKRASLSVFRPIGDPHAMYISPPVQSYRTLTGAKPRGQQFPASRLGYFNLHGLPNSSEWYGQRDPADPTGLPDYPVALRPQDVVNGGRAPQVVFSEACYGANIINKDIEEALALKFLASGSQAVVGSTCTAYGSITTPLIAGDLLGHAFWKYLREGLAAGEALRRAKIHLAREMHRRQGYLDGEDQKTLISFVLYGDPLSNYTPSGPRTKAVLRPVIRSANIKTVCERGSEVYVDGACIEHELPTPNQISPEAIAKVKAIVAEYLPGMQDARWTISQAHAGCTGEGHTCPSFYFGAKSRPEFTPQRSVVTLSKTVQAQVSPTGPKYSHHHFARLTLDGQGQLVKLSVSR